MSLSSLSNAYCNAEAVLPISTVDVGELYLLAGIGAVYQLSVADVDADVADGVGGIREEH